MRHVDCHVGQQRYQALRTLAFLCLDKTSNGWICTRASSPNAILTSKVT
jgi:hypothetical protein